MGYDDRFYYGKAKIYVFAATGSEVEVTDGVSTWEDVTLDGKCVFTLPGTKKYSVTVDGVTQTLTVNFGDCVKLTF